MSASLITKIRRWGVWPEEIWKPNDPCSCQGPCLLPLQCSLVSREPVSQAWRGVAGVEQPRGHDLWACPEPCVPGLYPADTGHVGSMVSCFRHEEPGTEGPTTCHGQQRVDGGSSPPNSLRGTRQEVPLPQTILSHSQKSRFPGCSICPYSLRLWGASPASFSWVSLGTSA